MNDYLNHYKVPTLRKQLIKNKLNISSNNVLATAGLIQHFYDYDWAAFNQFLCYLMSENAIYQILHVKNGLGGEIE